MELSKRDIRAILLFNFKKGRKAAESARDINETFGEEMTSEWSARKWFKRFRSGDLSLEDRERSGRPSVIDDGQLKTVIEKDPCKTTRKLAEELKVSQKTACNHLRALRKSRKLDKWVKHDLNEN
ncbi:histone-lysine N-methyltransferase SETMAR-like [Octopus vulgaris]|uniref:Histone-lysine N-methyltransferase SETMAR-like n=1 Tax=Octopus vulgaris TaxID=6645 RepID=A0AA36AZH9_OCTVU|nr:histone-lysine N-methyltransferase SETMAR-like [Octopus vulgaris]